jgi:hypothetical protein
VVFVRPNDLAVHRRRAAPSGVLIFLQGHLFNDLAHQLNATGAHRGRAIDDTRAYPILREPTMRRTDVITTEQARAGERKVLLQV